MQGLMMNTQLLIKDVALHAEANHGDREIVSITAAIDRHRYTIADSMRRARKISSLLDSMQFNEDARIGTLAWNDFRHL